MKQPQPLRLTVLGASGGYPTPNNPASGYLLRSSTTTLWIDAGSGTLAELQKYVGLAEVDAVFLSHEHADHCADIEVLHPALKYYERALPRLPVFSHKDVRKKFGYTKEDSVFDWRDVKGGDARIIGDMTLRFSKTDHPVETLALRVEWENKVFAYSADTGPDWDCAGFMKGANMALVEATGHVEQEGIFEHLHLSARQAGAMAKAAKANRLILTHLWPTANRDESLSEAMSEFGRRVELATPGDTLRV